MRITSPDFQRSHRAIPGGTSTMIVERLGALPRAGSVFDFIESIEDSLVEINAELLQTAAARGVDLIGSTVVVLVRDTDFMLCGWVGDSRAYCYADDSLRQITRDHVHGGDIDVTHFGAAPPPAAGSGVLTRAVGAEEQLFVDWVVAANRPDMAFVLCSDGINKEMSDAELHDQCRRHRQPQDLVDSLFELAMGRAGRDNISAVVVGLHA